MLRNVFSPPKATSTRATRSRPLGIWARLLSSLEVVVGGLFLLTTVLGTASLLGEDSPGLVTDALVGIAAFIALGVGFVVGGVTLRQGIRWPQYLLCGLLGILTVLFVLGSVFE